MIVMVLCDDFAILVLIKLDPEKNQTQNVEITQMS